MPRLVAMPRDVLFQRRLAGRALDLALDSYGLDGISVKLNADDPRVVLPQADGSLAFSEDWRSKHAGDGLARVYLMLDGEPPKARVCIPSLALLVRKPHRLEFSPAQVGIARDGRLYDVDVELDLSELLAQEAGPLYRIPQKQAAVVARRRTPVTHRCHSKLHRWPEPRP